MNSHTDYRRHGYQAADRVSSVEGVGAVSQAISQLAYHADPSVPATRLPASSAKRVAWVRPTELAGLAGPYVGRDIDLQAELTRRARRTPITAARAARRDLTRSLHTERTASREEGIGR